ncbi:MAG: hypothetical protein KIT10_06185 [Flavobacteriales bacterium]|nr:hypothetical protein [Flavobacteriales bacterium]
MTGPCRPSASYWLLAWLLPFLPATAQQWDVFDMATAGFPSNTVKAVVEDHDGVIWAATDWGLCRYDGDQWTVLQQGGSGLPDNSLNCLAVDGDGRLWIGTTSAGIAILDGEDWTYLTTENSPLVIDDINGITIDHRGWAWIATQIGLQCSTGEEWYLYNDTPESHLGYQFWGPHVRNTAVRADGLVAVATMNGGLTYISETDFFYYTSFEHNFPDNSANAIVFDEAGDRWIACPAGGLIRHAGPHIGGPWLQYNAASAGFPDNTLLCLVIDPQGRKLAGTETAGILRFTSAVDWDLLGTSTGLPDPSVRCLMIDSGGGLWAGTWTGGLARWRNYTSVGGEMEVPEQGVEVFPVPFQDHFTVVLPSSVDALAWDLMDASGRVVLNGRFAPGRVQQVVAPGMSSGIFVLRVRSNTDRWHVRLVRD